MAIELPIGMAVCVKSLDATFGPGGRNRRVVSLYEIASILFFD